MLSLSKFTLILGIGNSLRGDDGVGPYIIDKLKIENSQLKILNCGVVPEDYIDEISELSPDKIFIIDAANFEEKPGTVKIVDEINIPEKSLSTHNISLKVFVGLLKQFTQAKVFLIGIQPENMDYVEGLSKTVKASADRLVEQIVEGSIIKKYE